MKRLTCIVLVIVFISHSLLPHAVCLSPLTLQGIVMWELLTRQVPFANLNSFSIPVAVIKGDRPPVPKKDVPSGPPPPPFTLLVSLLAYKRIMRECWNSNPKKRPTMAKVCFHVLCCPLSHGPAGLRCPAKRLSTPLRQGQVHDSHRYLLRPRLRTAFQLHSCWDSGEYNWREER